MEQFTECEQQIKWTTSPKVFVEITLLTVANRFSKHNEQSVPSEELSRLMNRVTELERKLTELQHAPTSGGTSSNTAIRKEPNRTRKRTFDIPQERIYAVLDQAEKLALQQVKSQWQPFLEQLKQVNAPAHATIQNSKPVAASKEALIVAFKYEIHCSLFLDHKQTIESVLANTISQHLSIVPLPEADWYSIRTEYLSRKDSLGENKTEKNNPVVDEAVKLFGDDLVEVKD